VPNDRAAQIEYVFIASTPAARTVMRTASFNFVTRKPGIGHKLIEEFNEENYHQPSDEYEDWDSYLAALEASLCPPGGKAA
jgi:hypothetical protein